MVLTGETGSGKTTQIPQYLAAEAGWKGRIAVTQVFNFFNFFFCCGGGLEGPHRRHAGAALLRLLRVQEPVLHMSLNKH